MILGILLLLAGLTISAVAIYYSVLGLAAIFTAATIPIYIMGSALEISKLIAASWLKANWNRTKGFIKWYMFTAVAVLMLITSMGIFGFLSKAHLDQDLVSGNNRIQVEEINRQIAIEQRSIDDATNVISQLDQTIITLTNSQRIRGRDGAIAIRKAQTEERNELTSLINTATKRISELENQKLPLVQESLALEAKVGPIKYIAAFVYGSETDKELLEKAVTWVIILLVAVFDPLAIAMLLAAQMTFKWYREDKEIVNSSTLDLPQANSSVEKNTELNESSDASVNHTVQDSSQPVGEQVYNLKKHPYLFKKFVHFKTSTPMVAKPEETVEVQESTSTEEPTSTEELAATEAAPPTYHILPELVEESSKKKIHDQEIGNSSNSREEIMYLQNSEQTDNSLWKRVRDRDSEEFKAKDYLRFVYAKQEFDDIQYNPELEPTLDKFIKDIKSGTHSFSDYSTNELKYFAGKIYELRKN